MKRIGFLAIALLLLLSLFAVLPTSNVSPQTGDQVHSAQSRAAISVMSELTAPTGKCANGGKCDPGGDYYDMCEGVGLTTYDTCRAAGGSKQQCDAAAKESQNNCLRDFGCPIIN